MNFMHGGSTHDSPLWRRLGPMSSMSLCLPSVAAAAGPTPIMATVTSTERNFKAKSGSSDTIAYPQKENLFANAASGRPPSYHNSSVSTIKRQAHSQSVNPKKCKDDNESLLQRRNLKPLTPLIFNFEESSVDKPNIDSKSGKKSTKVASNNKLRNDSGESRLRNALKGTSNEFGTMIANPLLKQQSTPSTKSKILPMTPLMRSLISKYGTESPANNIKAKKNETPTKHLPSVNAANPVRGGSIPRNQIKEMKETSSEKAVTAIVHCNDCKSFAAATRCETDSKTTCSLSCLPPKTRLQTRAEAFELLKGKMRSTKFSSTSQCAVEKSRKCESLTEQKNELTSTTTAPPPTLPGRKDHAMRVMQQLKEQRASNVNNSTDANKSNGSKMAQRLSDNIESMTSVKSLCLTQKCGLLSRKEAAMRNFNRLREQRTRQIIKSSDANMSHGTPRSRRLIDASESISISDTLLVTQSCSFPESNSNSDFGSRVTQLELRRKKAREILAQRKQRQLRM